MADMKSIMAEIQQPLWHNWYIKEEIGSGASGTVYKIEAKRGNRTDVSALKVEPITLDDVLYHDQQKKKDLLEKKRLAAENETSIMYNLRKCKYIVGYEDEDIRKLNNTEGYVLLIRMEFLECLHTQVKEGRFSRSESNVLKLAHDIGRGIQAAHEANVIHRDIKPANFFYSPEDKTYKLGDFNISKTTSSARSFAGTEGYIAPEIYKAKQSVDNVYTKQADIYSFGICLYQLMNDLCFPFENDRLAEEAIDLRMSGVPLPQPKNASPEFSRIILRACAYDPMNRYASIDEMIADIKRLRGDDTPSVRTAPVPSPTPVEPVPAPMPVNPFSQNTADNSAFTDGISEHQQPKKKKSKGLIIAAVLLTVIVAAAATIAIVLLNKKNKDEDSSGSPDKTAEKFADALFDADSYDTIAQLTMPDDVYDAYKNTDDYDYEKENHIDDIESMEEYGYSLTVDEVEKGDSLSKNAINMAEFGFEYMAGEYDISADVSISEGYEYDVTYVIEYEDGETESETSQICLVNIEGEGWKVIPESASDLDY